MDDADLRRALAEEPAGIFVDRSWLAQDDRPGWAALRARLGAMARPVFPLHGRDVDAPWGEPGPRIGAVLRAVYAWWMAGGCVADAERLPGTGSAGIGALARTVRVRSRFFEKKRRKKLLHLKSWER